MVRRLMRLRDRCVRALGDDACAVLEVGAVAGRFTIAEGQAALDTERPADGYSRARIAHHRR